MVFDPLREFRVWQQRLEQLVGQPGAWTPAIDLYETHDKYVLSAEVPGLVREQIELAVEENRLTIRGSRPASIPDAGDRRYHQVERGYGSFSRTFEFNEAIATDRITADLHEGVLTVTLPKIPPAPARRIEVF